MVSLLGLGNVAVRATAAAAVVVGLTLGCPPVASAGSVAAEPAVAVAAAQGGLSATAASHPRKPPKKRRIPQLGNSPPDCSDRVVQPKIEVATALPQLGVPFNIQIRDFARDEPVELVVTRPDGLQRSKLIQPSRTRWFCDVHSYLFLAYPPDPLGLYRVVATQGSTTATATFTLLPPLRPSLNLLRFRLHAGKSVPFVLAGFDPGENVAMYLYRRVRDNTFETIYRRARHPARTIRVDEQGFALGNVTMRRGGHYLLSADALCCPEVTVR